MVIKTIIAEFLSKNFNYFEDLAVDELYNLIEKHIIEETDQAYADGLSDGQILLESTKEAIQSKSYDEGYAEGLEISNERYYTEGFDEGLEAGEDRGFKKGYKEGLTNKTLTSMTENEMKIYMDNYKAGFLEGRIRGYEDALRKDDDE
jgi:flagellar biosynthesis/type III secretory pathway protein FliH